MPGVNPDRNRPKTQNGQKEISRQNPPEFVGLDLISGHGCMAAGYVE